MTSVVVFFAVPRPGEAGSPACFDGSPATPVPEFVNGERIWPPSGLQPANPLDPWDPDRDSTTYVGLPTQLPGAGSGLELFTDLDIVGNYIYTAYNAGLQVWDISGANAAKPVRTAFRDGFARHFLNFEQTPTEVYFLIFGIDAIDPPTPGSDVLIGLAGHAPVGLSIWDATNKSSLKELYQDYDRTGEDVATAYINGRTYAFFAANQGGGAGLHVYDMTAARDLPLPCKEDTTAAITCPNVYKGELGNWFSVQYVSYLEFNNRYYIAVSDGATTAFGISIHEVLDPSTTFSHEIFTGLNVSAQGVGLFSYGGKAYLAVKVPTALQIYDVTTCLGSGVCTSLQTSTPVWSRPVSTPSGLVSVSTADAPYVYFGSDSPCLQGTKNEYLFNVSSLSSPSPVITEATEFPPGSPANADGKFSDPQTGKDVDYWGYYLDKNTSGFSFLIPRAAKAHLDGSGKVYVYRTAFTIFDVHQFGASVQPGVPSAIVNLGPAENASSLWLGDDIDFVATPQNCGGASDWQWWSRATGQISLNLGIDTSTHTHRWGVGPNQSFDVGATKLLCDSGETMVEDDVVPKSVTLQDPRPVVPGIAMDPAGGSYPHGQQVTFSSSGAISGKQPFTYQWQVTDDGGNPVPLLGTAGAQLDLNTCDLPFNVTDVFADGFESGNATRWGLSVLNPPAVGSPEPWLEKAQLAPVKVAGSFTVQLTASATVDDGSFSDSKSVPIEIVPPGIPAFDSATPLSSADLGLGQYEITANTNGFETQVRWEIEDVNGTSTCSFGTCVILDWGQVGAQMTYVWTTPNVVGPHKVTAALRTVKCDASFVDVGPKEIEVQVDTVTTPVPPTVTQFTVVEGGPANCSCPVFSVCTCDAGQPISFQMTTDVPVNSIQFTWGDGQSLIVSPSQDNLYTHTYASPNSYAPKVTATAGDLTSPEAGLPQLTLQVTAIF